MAEFHDDSRTVHQRRIEQRFGNGDVLSTTLGKFDDVRFQFFVGFPNAGGLDRLKLPVVGKNRNVGSVKRDVLNVNVVHQHVHFPVADEVPAKVVEQF